jgi:hypothetical protein
VLWVCSEWFFVLWEASEFFEVGGAELFEAACAAGCEVEAYESVIGWVDVSVDEAGVCGAVDESDCAVVAEHQGFGDLSDGWWVWAGVAADREEELVLRGGDADGGGLVFAPAEEASEAGS